jgi:large subunit ribosomal protein L29
MVKKKELSQLSRQNLEKKLIDLKKQLMQINSQISTGTPPENPGGIKHIKKTIARIVTFMKNKPINTTNKKKEQTGG